MPGLSASDVNVVSQVNSTNTPLGVFGTFTGQFVDVSGYSSVTLSVNSDVGSQFAGIELEWSTDGVAPDLQPQLFTFDPTVISQDGFTTHATVRGQYFRVQYTNANIAQTFFTLTTLLRKGTAGGTVRSIDPVNTFTTNLDVQSVQSLISGTGLSNPEQVQIAKMDDINFPSSNQAYLFVSPRPVLASNTLRSHVQSNLSSVSLLPGATPSRRVFISITNNVLRGNLFIKLNTSSGLTTTQYDYKILPGHTWQDSGAFGSVFAGDIFGRWDEIYVHSVPIQAGFAEVVVNYYGP